ncbi:MAG: YibE/F family protein [Patescibacteria group bacterium]
MKLLFVSIFLFAPFFAQAQTPVPDTVTIVKAQVTNAGSSTITTLPGTTIPQTYQTIRAQILEGSDAGKTVEFDNDYLTLKVGDVFYARHQTSALDGTDFWSVGEPYRLPVVEFFVGLFLLSLLLVGGKQGVRGLLALIAGLFFIIYLLLPGILAGYPPLLIAGGVSALIVIAGSYLTHGVNRATSAAVLGMLLTIAVVGTLAYLAVHLGRFSGYTTEESTYLNFDTQGSIDFVGLLLGSLMIGLLGVLYDAAIGQAVAVDELARAAIHWTRRELFVRGMRIGREHIGALVNILAIAYVGASLPLLLLFKVSSTQSIWVTLNSELFATEIIRITIGSIGLILAVPITTAVAVYLLHGGAGEGTSTHHHR